MLDDAYTFNLHIDIADSLPDDAEHVRVELVTVAGGWIELRVTCRSKQGHTASGIEN